jgi:hypothetical protein
MKFMGACAVICVLSACGGGGSLNDGQESLKVNPSTVVVSGPVGSCYSGLGPTVFVFGGNAPYTLRNSLPIGLFVDKTVLRQPGEGVTLSFNGTCFDTLPLIVTDNEGVSASVTISNVKGIP